MPDARQSPSLRALVLYFLQLGTLGFGGPVALVGYMQRDLVERRGWISDEEYKEGLALAQLAPGPLAAQLAMYLGWIRAGVTGATLVAIAFILPSWLMVVGLSMLYVRFGGLPWMTGVFYGIGAAVIAIIVRSVVKLVNMTVKRDALLWVLFLVAGITTAWTEREVVWLFLLSGLVSIVVKTRPAPSVQAASIAPLFFAQVQPTMLSSDPVILGRVLLFFAEAGLMVFGSGLAIVPFLHGGVVQQFHWLNERQFLDAVAISMITPGPIVITVAFIGYVVDGIAGAAVAALGVFLPVYLIVITVAPHFRRWSKNARVRAFVQGVTAAATGAIAGAAVVLARRAIVDSATIAIALVTLVVLLKVKVPEPIVILFAGAVGLAVHGF